MANDERFAGVTVRERYGPILVLILIGYVMDGFSDRLLIRIGSVLPWMAMLLLALWAPGIHDRLRTAGVAITLMVSVVFLAVAVSGQNTATGLAYLGFAAAQLLALIAILARITRHERVSVETVMGAVAAYALIGFTMGSVFQGIDLLDRAPVLEGVRQPGDYVYFSFLTMTTVGYGDIAPATDLVKRLVVIEAFVGQVFLVTLVARLVSMWGRPLQRPRDPSRL